MCIQLKLSLDGKIRYFVAHSRFLLKVTIIEKKDRRISRNSLETNLLKKMYTSADQVEAATVLWKLFAGSGSGIINFRSGELQFLVTKIA